MNVDTFYFYNYAIYSPQKSNGNRCPDVTTPTSCLSTGFFVFVILLQSIGAVVFLVYKYNQERNAKKFFQSENLN